MSVAFNGTTGYLALAASIRSSLPFSMFFWMKVNFNGLAQNAVSMAASAQDRWSGVWIDPNGTSFYASHRMPGANDSITLTPSVSAWVPVLYTHDGTTRSFRIGASGPQTSTGNLTDDLSNYDNLRIGALKYNSAAESNFFSGSIAEVHFWSSVLSGTDWTTLSGGALPESVQSGTYIDGWPLQTISGLTSLGGTRTLSLVGGVTNSAQGHPITRTSAATAVTMSGPSSGTVGVASSNFTVGANGSITGTVVVTPSDGGAGGTFTPTTVSISNGTPTATFTYTPSSTGAKTISATNNGSLSNPGNLTYTANAAAASAITLSGPSSGNVGVASTNFTVGANGTITGTIAVTPSDSGGGGTFTPTSVNISAAQPTATFTYTPASTGAKTISVSNNGGLSNPSNITYTASTGPATAVTLSGPSSGNVGVASTNFTVGANGAITGTVTVTPSDGGGGGTFTPTSVNISSGSPTATFTYTPASAGAKTISVTNNGSLSNPSNLTYTASAVAGRITTPPMGNKSGKLAGLWASQTGVKVNVYNATTGALVVQKTGLTTDSSGVCTFTDPAIAPGTQYSYEVVMTTGDRRLPLATAT